MSKWLKGVSAWAFGLLVVAALAVGAQSAFAQPVMMTCPNDGWVYLGSCVDQPDCQRKCDDVHGVGQSQGVCNPDGCCRCLF